MQKFVNTKIALAIVLGISILIWLIILLATETKFIINWDAIKHLPTVLTIDMIIYWIFIRWGWKWEKFQGWLVPFPDLNGEWEGKIKSLWINSETGQKKPKITATLTISQTFLNVHCKLKTDESESMSYSSSFIINPDAGKKQLIYNYFNKPKPSYREKSVPHDGTVLLNINVENESIRLDGEYWTSRETIGELEFKRKDL